MTALSTRKSFFSASFHNGSSRVPPTVCGTPAKAFLGSRTERLSPQMRFMVHELPFRQAAVTVLRKRKTAGWFERSCLKNSIRVMQLLSSEVPSQAFSRSWHSTWWLRLASTQEKSSKSSSPSGAQILWAGVKLEAEKRYLILCGTLAKVQGLRQRTPTQQMQRSLMMNWGLCERRASCWCRIGGSERKLRWAR